jgi:transcriptional regulator with XRE-family HTH domain
MTQILEQLRQAREAQGLDVEALAHRTRLRVHLLEAVEQGRFEALPRGVYARAVVRAYAEAVGIDPHRVITEVASQLPEPEDPIEGMARVRGFERPAQPSAAVETPDAGSGELPRPTTGLGPPAVQATVAAAIDTTVLLAATAILTAGTAAVSGIAVPEVVRLAAPAILAQALLVGGLYFVLMGGVGGATLGERVVEPQASRRRFRGTLGAAARRAGRLALRQASIVVSVAMPWPAPGPDGRREERRSRTRLEAGAPAR